MLLKPACNMQQDGSGTLCNVTLTAPQRMAAPVFVYYELDNFYQNHRRCVQHSAGASSKVCGPTAPKQLPVDLRNPKGRTQCHVRMEGADAAAKLQVPEQQERCPA